MANQEIRIFDQEGVFGAFTTRNITAPERRNALAAQADSFGGTVAWPHLVHGTRVAVLREEDLGKGLLQIPDTDGCITNVPGIALTVTCGDCLPVYAWDPVRKVIGLVHAGWKGTLGGIAAEMILAMEREFGTDPADVTAWVGPGISACCFKVREDCYEQFLDKYYWTEDFLYHWPDGTFSLDLKGINLELLQLCGVEDIHASSRCTCCEPETFYSYRRCKEMDRMLAYLYIKPQEGGPQPGFLPSLGLSRCLLGEACRYDGKSKKHPLAEALTKHYYPVPVCPEQLGGLPTPRNGSEVLGDKVVMKVENESLLAGMRPESAGAKKGRLLDVTREYRLGAEAALRELAANGTACCVLKSKSPSCGLGKIYDGSFTRTLIPGNGVAAEAFLDAGLQVVSSSDDFGLSCLLASSEELKEQKKALRKEVRAAEKAMTADAKKAADEAIVNAILSMPEYKDAASVFAFAGTSREIRTTELLKQILADGKTLYLPLCTGDGIMEAKKVESLDQLAPGAYGILEPSASLPSAGLCDIDFAVIPCVSCSHSGKRLGQGGGFYDRFLADYKGPSALVCREALVREEIPAESHDILLRTVVTDEGIFRS